MNSDNKFDINDCFDKKVILESLHMLSHLIVASLLVVMLKNTNPMLLTALLASMLIYISYDCNDKLPIYSLYTIGTIMYIVDFLATVSYNPETLKYTTANIIYKSIWKLPYFGILSYYIIMYAFNCKYYDKELSNLLTNKPNYKVN